MSTLKHFQYGDSTGALLQLDERISAAHSDPAATQNIERELIEVLESDVSLAAKQEACRRLSRIGTDDSVEALGSLLKSDDPHLAEAACYAISRRESTAATGALVAALSRPADPGLVAIANLLGDREAADATGKLIELIESSAPPVRDAAIAALGKIATSEALAACHAALDRGHSEAKHALLESAQRTEQRRLG